MKWIRNLWLDLLALIFPVRCVGCGRWDRALCEACLREVKGFLHTKPPYPYRSVLGRVLRAIKHNNMPALIKVFKPLMQKICEIMPEGAVWVPMPSIAEHIQNRGFDHLRLLLRASGVVGSQVVPALKPTRYRVSQVGLTAQERLDNAKCLRVKKRYLNKLRRASYVIVFDDVRTTGASMREAVNSLKNAGISRIVGCTLLAT